MKTDEDKQLEQEIYDAQVNTEETTLNREEETKDFQVIRSYRPVGK